MNKRIHRKLHQIGHVLHTERAPEKNFYSWFTQDILGFDSEDYHREFWREFYSKGHTIGHVPQTFENWLSYRGPCAIEHLWMAFFIIVSLGIPCYIFHFCRQTINARLRRYRRPTYYEAERARRQALGKARRAIRARRTYNACPTMDDIREAWKGARHNPENALRLGGMLEDLECYINNSPRGNAETGYRGRYGGIKRQLAFEAPDLFAHYAALMHYKSIARKFRQACEVEDPIPADALLPVRVRGDKKDGECVALNEQGAGESVNSKAVIANGSTGEVRDLCRSYSEDGVHDLVRSNQISRDENHARVGECNRVCGDVNGGTCREVKDGNCEGGCGVTYIERDRETCQEGIDGNLCGCRGVACGELREVPSQESRASDEECHVGDGEAPGGAYGEIGVRWVAGRLFPARAYLRGVRPQKIAAEILGTTEPTVISLEAVLALQLDPECISVSCCSPDPIAVKIPGPKGSALGERDFVGEGWKHRLPARLQAWIERHSA